MCLRLQISKAGIHLTSIRQAHVRFNPTRLGAATLVVLTMVPDSIVLGKWCPYLQPKGNPVLLPESIPKPLPRFPGSLHIHHESTATNYQGWLARIQPSLQLYLRTGRTRILDRRRSASIPTLMVLLSTFKKSLRRQLSPTRGELGEAVHCSSTSSPDLKDQTIIGGKARKAMDWDFLDRAMMARRWGIREHTSSE